MIEELYKIFLSSSGICTDTRLIKEGNIFFALKGPNFNANEFAASALESGAILAIIDEEKYAVDGKTMLVRDGLATLQELAMFHRKHLKIPIIGITGSNGKTTTKELIQEVLSTTFKTFATQGNLNNHIGVPLSVLSITSQHEVAVIEMGANHIGEIASLCAISQPTHGLITNIGKAHIGLFGGFEGVIRAKSELYDYLIKNNGKIFINQNQEILMNMRKRMNNPVFYPNENSDYPCRLLDADPFLKIESKSGITFSTQLIGEYNFDNIATALCLAHFFKVPEDRACAAVANYSPTNNRSQILKKGSNTIILDAYNANPSSMEKAIENLAKIKSEKKLAILGDMFELGDDTEKEHDHIGLLLKKHQINDAIFCGTFMISGFRSFGKGHYTSDKSELIKYLKSMKLSNTTILIKASRGMALEQVVEYLE
jgi:UDP-N-acetylmuramoyl-tripeptide--D-alanyl-D-alanine ligase